MTTPTTVQVRLQLRQDTAANWTSVNPTLLAGELGRESDTGKIKIGTGSAAWTALAYMPGGQLSAYPIVNVDIAAGAEIAVSKLADGTARQLLQTDAAGTGVEWASNIDVPGTLDVTSAATFDSTVAVTGALTKSGSNVVTVGDTGTVTSTMILDGTILNADVNASAAIVDTKLATIATAGKVSNSATTATDANTASAIVARDASGNFTAGTITAAVTGAASSNVLKAGDTMTGALVHPLGAVGTPSLTFTGDLNTGFYSPGADTLAAVTAGNNRLHITSAGLVGIGISDPSTLLTLGTNAPRLEFNDGDAATDNKRWQFFTGSTSFGLRALTDAGAAGGNQFSFTRSNENINSFQGLQGGSAWFYVDNSTARVGIGTTSPGAALEINAAAATSPFIAKINTAEAARIDSSGRLLVGTSSARSAFFNAGFTPSIQFEGTGSGGGRVFALTNNSTANDPPLFVLGKSNGSTLNSNTLVSADTRVGTVSFQGSDGTELVEAAAIYAEVDGTPSANDLPGRLVFSTTADGASSPTEALRITNDRVIAYNQPTPTSKSAAATLTITELKTGIIQYTGAVATLTLPTGTLMEGGFSGIYTNMAFEWSVINTGAGICTVAAGTDHTVIGSGTVAIGASARFVSRRTAANTFVSYRLS